MNECIQTGRLNAYHDGELAPEARAEMDRHLAQCPRCAAELGRLRKLSRLLGSMPPARMSAACLPRLHRAIDRAPLAGLVRLAEALMALAATILVACILGLATLGPSRTQASAMPVWEADVVASTSAEPAAETADEQQLANWVVHDLSGKDEHD